MTIIVDPAIATFPLAATTFTYTVLLAPVQGPYQTGGAYAGTPVGLLVPRFAALDVGPATLLEIVRPQAAPGAFTKSSPTMGATGQPTNLMLSWGASNGATSYEYCYDTTYDSACDGNWTSTGSNRGAVISGLSAGMTYYWQARARNALGTTNADSGTWWSFATQMAVPGAFAKSNPAAGATGQATSLTLTWGAASGATSYSYCYDTTDNSNCDGAWRYNGSSTSAAIIGLSAGTTYYWQVRAQNTAGGTGADSGTWWDFTTQVPLPGAFAKSSPADGVTGQPANLVLNWGAGSGAASYEYCYDTTNDNSCSGSWTNTGNTTTAAISGLSAGTTYYWQVRARNATGATDADSGTWWSFTTQVPLPGAFAKSSPAAGATGQPASLTLNWSAGSGATSYEYCYDTTNDNSCDGSWTSTGSNTSAAISGLSSGTTYYWQVRARNVTGATDADSGTWWSFTTTSVRADFDGNGVSDLVWRYIGSGPYQGWNSIWYMNGDGSVKGYRILSSVADTNWQTAGNADFDGDGVPDILWRYCGTGSFQGWNSIWYMNADGSVRAYRMLMTVDDLGWQIAGAWDMDGDGVPEIVWRYYGTGPYQGWNSIWHLNVDGSIKSFKILPTVPDTSWQIAGGGDFDGDGVPDLLWRYYGTGVYQGWNSIWYMNADGSIKGTKILTAVSELGWQIAGTGDFDRDGSLDILWRCYGIGSYQGWNSVWFMNPDGSQKGWQLLNPVPDTNWIVKN